MSFDLKLVSGNLSIKNGDFETVSGKEKLIQDTLKIALTKAGSNPIFPWYGSFISQSMVGSVLDQSITVNYAKNQLTNTLNTLKSLQEKQATYQNVSSDELIYAISNISITKDPADPTFYKVYIKLINKSISNITVAFNV